MAVLGLPEIPLPLVIVAVVALFAIQRIYYELTTGARRRRMIRENGCEEIYTYPHKGIGGRLLGLDVIKDMTKAGKEGRFFEAMRFRNFKDGRNTIRIKLLRNKGVYVVKCLG